MRLKILNSNLEFIVMAFVALIVLTPLLYGLASLNDSQNSQVFIEKPDEQYDKCVRDTEYMRINHMDLLKTIRDEIVRDGERGPIELNNCRDCHTSREKFCDKCHNVVGLQVACFGCHYYPE